MNFETMDALYTKLLKINHLMSLSLAEIAKEEDLNPSELMIVLDVKNNPHTDLQSVCERLGMKKSTASKAIRKLIDVGYIENHVCESDQRKVSLVGKESTWIRFGRVRGVHWRAWLARIDLGGSPGSGSNNSVVQEVWRAA